MKPIYKNLILFIIAFCLFTLTLYFLAGFDLGSSIFISFGATLLTFYQINKS